MPAKNGSSSCMLASHSAWFSTTRFKPGVLVVGCSSGHDNKQFQGDMLLTVKRNCFEDHTIFSRGVDDWSKCLWFFRPGPKRFLHQLLFPAFDLLFPFLCVCGNGGRISLFHKGFLDFRVLLILRECFEYFQFFRRMKFRGCHFDQGVISFEEVVKPAERVDP